MTVLDAARRGARTVLACAGLVPSPDREARALFAMGLAGITALLLLIPYVPFQDIPNHAFILLLDDSREVNPYFSRPEVTSFGYLLSNWIARALVRFFSADMTLRLMCLAGALALPLAAARLAAVLDIRWALAGILVLPLGLGWPMRMGFVSFVLGQPVVLMGAAAALRLCRQGGWRRGIELASWAIAAYLLHAFAFVFLAALVALVWLFTAARSLRAGVSLLATLIPAGALAALDVANRALSPVIPRDPSMPAAGISFRPLGRAVVHLLSRSYGISGPGALAYYLPHFLLLLAGIGLLAARRERKGAYLALAGTAVLTLGSVVFPDSVGNVYLLGPRLNVVTLCFAVMAAAAGLSAWGRGATLAAAGVTALAVAFTATEIGRDARLLEQVVGARPPRSVSGHYFPVRAAECVHVQTFEWGNWDPLRHTWAYALSPASGAPYLFTRHRYAPVWYRVDRILPHPFEGDVVSDEDNLEPESCTRRNRERVEGALTWPGYDGVVLVGIPGVAKRAIETSDTGEREPIAPGVWRLQADTRAVVDFGNPTAYRTGRGGFGRDERREGRTVSWSKGPISWVDLDLAVEAGETYWMRLVARPDAGAFPHNVSVEVNGSRVAVLQYSSAAWGDISIVIPAGVLRSGRNRLGFLHGEAAGPGDAGSLAPSPQLDLLFDRLEIRRGAS
jgi:hypothetical protein